MNMDRLDDLDTPDTNLLGLRKDGVIRIKAEDGEDVFVCLNTETESDEDVSSTPEYPDNDSRTGASNELAACKPELDCTSPVCVKQEDASSVYLDIDHSPQVDNSYKSCVDTEPPLEKRDRQSVTNLDASVKVEENSFQSTSSTDKHISKTIFGCSSGRRPPSSTGSKGTMKIRGNRGRSIKIPVAKYLAHQLSLNRKQYVTDVSSLTNEEISRELNEIKIQLGLLEATSEVVYKHKVSESKLRHTVDLLQLVHKNTCRENKGPGSKQNVEKDSSVNCAVAKGNATLVCQNDTSTVSEDNVSPVAKNYVEPVFEGDGVPASEDNAIPSSENCAMGRKAEVAIGLMPNVKNGMTRSRKGQKGRLRNRSTTLLPDQQSKRQTMLASPTDNMFGHSDDCNSGLCAEGEQLQSNSSKTNEKEQATISHSLPSAILSNTVCKEELNPTDQPENTGCIQLQNSHTTGESTCTFGPLLRDKTINSHAVCMGTVKEENVEKDFFDNEQPSLSVAQVQRNGQKGVLNVCFQHAVSGTNVKRIPYCIQTSDVKVLPGKNGKVPFDRMNPDQTKVKRRRSDGNYCNSTCLKKMIIVPADLCCDTKLKRKPIVVLKRDHWLDRWANDSKANQFYISSII